MIKLSYLPKKSKQKGNDPLHIQKAVDRYRDGIANRDGLTSDKEHYGTVYH